MGCAEILGRKSGRSSRGGAERTLIGLEFFTGLTALAGGVLLMVRPDGSLLRADRSVLAGTPFADWLAPGILLASLVGAGFLLAGVWQLRRGRFADYLSMACGVGLIVFEVVQVLMIGFQPLQAVFAGVGAAVATLALRMSRRTHTPAAPTPEPLHVRAQDE